MNAGAANARNLAQGGMDLSRGIYNTGAMNDRAVQQAQLAAQAGMFNTDLGARTSMFNAGQGDVAANRDLAAAGLVANTAANIGAGTRADTALTGDLGTMQQAIEQAQRTALPSHLAMQSSLYGALPYPALIGQQMDGTMQGTSSSRTNPGFGNVLMNAASNAAMAAAMASDRRLKENIEQVGSLADGLGVYEFEYRDGFDLPTGRFVGVMADEVAELRPWALGPELPGGYATVNYALLGG